MICPYCNAPGSHVFNSRERDGGRVVYRQRRCDACGQKWETWEGVDLPSKDEKERFEQMKAQAIAAIQGFSL